MKQGTEQNKAECLLDKEYILCKYVNQDQR